MAQAEPQTPPTRFISSPSEANSGAFGTETTQYFLENATLINVISNVLRGLRYDPRATDKKNPWKQGEPLIPNEEGVEIILSELNAYTHKDTKLTKMDIWTVTKICLELDLRLIEILANNREHFGIKQDRMTMIKDTVTDNVFFALTRSEGEGERKFLGTIKKIVENINKDETPKKEGWF